MKQQGQRVDFKPDQFDLAIETKGYLLNWERAAICPCKSPSGETEQPDPNCDLCDGQGWYYFGAPTAQDLSEYTFDDIQQKIITDTNGMVIRGIITSIENSPNPVDELGRWVEGSMNCTVRHQNKIAYYDRLTALDTEINFAEKREADGTTKTVGRYLMTGVNELRSKDTIYVPDTDYELNSEGSIDWLTTPPVSGTLLALHYYCHPTYIVINHPHVARTTSLIFKLPVASRKAPTGDPRPLPVQAKVMYDFLRDR